MGHRLLFYTLTLLATTLGLALSAAAQEAPEAGATAVSEEDEGWSSHLSGTIGWDFTNAYFFRGILQERDSFIAQPYGELDYSVYQSEDGPIRDITIGAGVWASFHTEETLASDNPKSLYEVDWYPTISLTFPGNVSLTTTYYFYSSPNDAFKAVQELNFNLAWDDSEVLGRFALQPWMNLAIETHRTSFGPNKGEGLQMGIEPTLYEIPIEDYPVTLTLPVELGLALGDYYEVAGGHESTFGYLSYGLSASVPLAFIPETLGAWSFGVTGKGYYLSNTLRGTNLGRHNSPVVTGSFAVEF